MQKLFILLIVGLFLMVAVPSPSLAVSAKGYYKKNGTYVAPYVRSSPNGLKYDNYGYKPSQGLYNKTYGTNGSYWNTPSYITDPNYYKEKSFYDSKSVSLPSYSTYAAPSYKAAPIYKAPVYLAPINVKSYKDCTKGFGYSYIIKDCIALAPGSF